MSLRAVSLAALLATVSLPAYAQAPVPPGQALQTLAADVAGLKARVDSLEANVAKLNGNLTAADLVGTYAIYQFQTELTANVPNPTPPPPFLPASIAAGVTTGIVTLNADGSGSVSTTDSGSTLTQGVWTLTPSTHNSSSNFTWAYANGVLSVTANDGVFNFNVGPSGGVLVGVFSAFNRSTQPFADAGLIIVVRQH